jgi:hypothetical protein
VKGTVSVRIDPYSGKADFKDLTITAKVSSKAPIVFTSSKYVAGKEVRTEYGIQLEPCRQGYYLPKDSDEKCIKCEAGQYSVEKNADTCLLCEKGAGCIDGIYAKPGYWNAENSTRFHPCPQPSACLGGPLTGCSTQT